MLDQQKLALLEISNRILAEMNKLTIDNGPLGHRLTEYREITLDYLVKENVELPLMAASVATVLLGAGLCQELTYYFVQQYFLVTGRQDVSLIFLKNPKRGRTNKDHMLVQLGDIVTDNDLDQSHPDAFRPTLIESYFWLNSDSVFVDPLLKCAGDYKEGLANLKSYCKMYDLTHVVGVSVFRRAGINDVFQVAKQIKSHSERCAEYVRSVLNESYVDQITAVFNKYNRSKLNGSDNDLTKEFYNSIPSGHSARFQSSARRILQLGVSLGQYVSQFSGGSREVVGYDISDIAINEAQRSGITARKINLDELKDDNGVKVLAYQSQLAEDLSTPTDLLAICFLEYLKPETLMVLLQSIIDLMKPESQCYFNIGIYTDSTSGRDFLKNHFFYPVQAGYVPSFFAPRTDVQIDYHDLKSDDDDIFRFERFIVQKR